MTERRQRLGSVDSTHSARTQSSVSSAGSVSADQLTARQKLAILTKGYVQALLPAPLRSVNFRD